MHLMTDLLVLLKKFIAIQMSQEQNLQNTEEIRTGILIWQAQTEFYKCSKTSTRSEKQFRKPLKQWKP